jgi:hypothetical protein
VITLAALVASVVGALIVQRHPHHRIGWLFLVGQVGTMFGLACQSYGFVALSEDWGPRLPAQIALWVSILTGGILALALMALLLLLAPDGHLLSRRWRWTVWVTLLGLVLHDAAVATVSPTRLDAEARIDGAAGWVPVVTLLAGSLVLVGLVAGAVSLVIRTRRAVGDERMQLRWIGSAAFALAASVPFGVLIDLVLGVPTWLAGLPMMLAYLAVPVLTGVAILRFRLYDIDFLINRSLVLATLTIGVAGAYVAVVVGLSHLVGAHGHDAWTSVLATVVVALGFQPVRRRLDQLVDRLVYGARAAPYEALATFSDELQAGVSAADLLPRVAEVTGRTIGARRATAAMLLPDGSPAGEWSADGSPRDDGTAFPVVVDGERQGVLTVFMARGRGLRSSERELLEDFAAQLAPALRTLRLEHELAAQVEALAEMGLKLDQSRCRLLSVEASERVRFEAAINREVLPHVRDLPATLERIADSPGSWPSEEIDHLIDETGHSLAALRTLTRGVFPAQLEHRGLAHALASHLDPTAHELTVAQGLRDRRLPAQLEAAGYFCAVEALSAFEGPTRVCLDVPEGRVTLAVTGRPRASFVPDTEHLMDRAEAAGGSLLRRMSDQLATVTVVLPLTSEPRPEPDGTQLVGVEG